MSYPPNPNEQPYGAPPSQPYPAPSQPYGTPPSQPYPAPGQQYGAPPSQPYGAPPQYPPPGYAAPPGYGAPPAYAQPYGMPAAPASNGLATSSLILGCCSLILGLLTAIPAVITGHMALNRIQQNPALQSTKGQAMAGLIIGYVIGGLYILCVGILIASSIAANGSN